MKKCNFFPSVLATVLLFSLPLLLLIGCSTDNNEKIPTEPSTNENLLPYQNEVIIAGIWPEQSGQPEAKADELVVEHLNGTEPPVEHIFIPVELRSGKLLEGESIPGMHLNFSGTVEYLDAGAGNFRYKAVSIDVLSTFR